MYSGARIQKKEIAFGSIEPTYVAKRSNLNAILTSDSWILATTNFKYRWIALNGLINEGGSK